MPNMSLIKNPMTLQEPDVRVHNFDEVATGYGREAAIDEAKRCLQCRDPKCVAGCPVAVQIPEFIKAVADGDFERGYQLITETNALPAVCGRVCPQETQCEELCIRARKGESVGIGRLERFCADEHMRTHPETQAVQIKKNGYSVAVIGSGPAGLTCAGELARMGYDVTVYEALHMPGGVLVYGIPQFRLPKEIVAREVEGLRALGVKIEMNMVIGRILSINELFDMGFSAVFIGSGAGLPSFMGIPGENLSGVFSANEYLTRINLMKAYRPNSYTPAVKANAVAVIGGGNVAMDAARSALRMGSQKVYIVYRRGDEEMPARREEIEHAREEGVEFMLLTAPTEILGDEAGRVRAMKCIKMQLGAPDASGRRRPEPMPGSEFELPLDCVIMAIGTSPNPLLRSTTPGLETDKHGCLIVADDGVSTTREGVFAGGDTVTGAATVILAMGAGREAAKKIDEYVKGKNRA